MSLPSYHSCRLLSDVYTAVADVYFVDVVNLSMGKKWIEYTVSQYSSARSLVDDHHHVTAYFIWLVTVLRRVVFTSVCFNPSTVNSCHFFK
uniref:Uncharacterized protein n=1 Tax=Arion vulgaris TaxID=1028688 RepID=A0A0B7AI59_9EUPU